MKRFRYASGADLAARVNAALDFCEGQMAEDVHGGLTDAAPVWPSEIVKILQGEEKKDDQS